MKKYPDEFKTTIDRSFKIYKKYDLTKNEENNLINYINQLLSEFESQLDLITIDTTSYSIMPLGRKICESMMELLLKKEGYCIKKYSPFIETIQFSTRINILPKKYSKSLNSIRRYANMAIHGEELKYGKILLFLKEFSKFIKWFNMNFSNYEKEVSIVENINLKIDSILKNANYTNKNDKTLNGHPTQLKDKFYRNEESEDIHEINKLLNDYGNQLKLLSSEKKFYYAFLGSRITESMLNLLLKKEELYNTNKRYIFYEYNEILYEHNIIPKECYNFLHLIRRYRNEFIHGKEQSDRLVLHFLKALNYFIQWFDNYYFNNYQNKFQIEECCGLIDSLTYDEKNHTLTFVEKQKEEKLKISKEHKIKESKINNDLIQIKNEIKSLEKEKSIKNHEKLCSSKKDDSIKPEIENVEHLNKKIKILEYELKIQKELQEKQLEDLNNFYLKKLDEYGNQFSRCMEILNEINERGKRIEPKIDEIHSKINTILDQNKSIQSLIERQIKEAQSREEIEKLIGFYVNECIDNIMSCSQNFTENQNYRIEKQKLIYSIGEEGWNKLCEKSKTFLITSKVMYNHLITMDDIIDYSGICVLVTKALEVEIHKRFFTNFITYLNQKFNKDYTKYHTALLYQYKKPLFSEKFTMGNIAFVMCYTENWNDTNEQKRNNRVQLMEYCKECIFSKYTKNQIDDLLTTYASKIEEIREKYRNPSAHTNEIKRVDAEECFNLVLDIEKLLKQMLDSFDE